MSVCEDRRADVAMMSLPQRRQPGVKSEHATSVQNPLASVCTRLRACSLRLRLHLRLLRGSQSRWFKEIFKSDNSLFPPDKERGTQFYEPRVFRRLMEKLGGMKVQYDDATRKYVGVVRKLAEADA